MPFPCKEVENCKPSFMIEELSITSIGQTAYLAENRYKNTQVISSGSSLEGGYLKGRNTAYFLDRIGKNCAYWADLGNKNTGRHRNFYFDRYGTDILK